MSLTCPWLLGRRPVCILDTNPLLVKSWLVLFNVNIALHPAETSNSTILAIFSSVEDGFFLLQKCLPGAVRLPPRFLLRDLLTWKTECAHRPQRGSRPSRRSDGASSSTRLLLSWGSNHRLRCAGSSSVWTSITMRFREMRCRLVGLVSSALLLFELGF